MATQVYATLVAEKFGYTFGVLDWLKLALTAAGAEEDNHDGNRGLAKIGDAVLELVINDLRFENTESRGSLQSLGLEAQADDIKDRLNTFRKLLKSKERRASAAKIAGIDCHIKLCDRSRGIPTTGVLSLATSAIVGAVWKDSGSLNAVGQVLNHLIDLCSAEATSADSEAAQVGNVTSVQATAEEGEGNSALLGSAASPMARIAAEDITLDVSPVVPSNDCVVSIENLGLNQFLTDDSYEYAVRQMPLGTARFSEDLTHDMGYNLPDDYEESTMWSELPSDQISIAEPAVDRYLTPATENVTQHSSTAECLTPDSANPSSRFSSEAPQHAGDLDKRAEVIHQIFDGICSAGSIVTLVEMIKACRAQGAFCPRSPLEKYTWPERLQAIDKIENQTTYLVLVKWVHVLQLYIEYPDAVASGDNFVAVDVAQATASGKRKRVGNALNISKSEATDAFLSDAFPELKPGSRQYEAKRLWAKRLRRLGRRLHILTRKFGFGILGLIQNVGHYQESGRPLIITDTTLLNPPDVVYDQVVNTLQNTHGKQLESFSRAVEPIVFGLVSRSLNGADSLPLERAGIDDILELPRFSADLLALISA